MEGANESGRAAVNALLEEAGSKAEPVRMSKLYDPPEFEALKAVDRSPYSSGQPNAIDLVSSAQRRPSGANEVHCYSR